MTNSKTHFVSAFEKPNGFIVFAVTNIADKALITSDLQSQYGGGRLVRQYALNLPLAMAGWMTKMTAQAIVKAGYPPIKAQLQLIDDIFAPKAVA